MRAAHSKQLIELIQQKTREQLSIRMNYYYNGVYTVPLRQPVVVTTPVQYMRQPIVYPRTFDHPPPNLSTTVFFPAPPVLYTPVKVCTSVVPQVAHPAQPAATSHNNHDTNTEGSPARTARHPCPVTQVGSLSQNNSVIAEDATLIESEQDCVDCLSLPYDTFPRPLYMGLDANDVIGAICTTQMRPEDMMWLLDIDFGVATTKGTPARYDIGNNTVVCDAAPAVVHPGWNQCDAELYTSLVSYYREVFSIWFQGFEVHFSDDSVANFEAWMNPVLRSFGFAWR